MQITLIKKGKAQVDERNVEGIREYLSTLTKPGKESSGSC
jgi:hypothetical protein